MNAFTRIASLAIAGLFAPPLALAGDEPFTRPGPIADFESFRALKPMERLKLIEQFAPKTRITAVSRGDLVAEIVERGAIEPARSFDIVCKVKSAKDGAASSTIKWLVDDGAMVKKGDRLASLDDSALRDRLEAAKIRLIQAESAKKQADESLDLSKREHEVDVRLAEIELKVAELELKDPAAGQSKAILELKAERAQLMLERTKARGKARLVQAEAERQARTVELEVENRRFREVEAEIEHCVMTSPVDGMAMYYVPPIGRFGGAAAAIGPGEPVREGQKLLRVCELKDYVVATRIHEAVISRVRNGHAADVRVDAIPDRPLRGKVTHVSPLAAPADWAARDVKVYPVTISLEDPPPGLKPGMSAEIRIPTGERKGVLQIPLKAVWNTGRDRVCFVKAGNQLVEHSIVVGASNSTSVEVQEGLKEGDEVVADLAALFAPMPARGKRSPAK
jgi:multidrug efflux pump subunit AcrA (membrane-fusion protein)